MDIYYLGAASFRLKGKTATIILDPFDPEFTGLKLPKDMSADAVLSTHAHQDHNNLSAVAGEPVKITGPGEYEVKGVAIEGVASFHDKVQGQERGRNTIYHINMDGLNIVHLGDLGHTLTQDQIQQVGITDILLVPVGGVYTIDATEATEVVSQLEPKVIIPMHYQLPGMKYELESLENFLKEMGKDNIEPVGKLSITKDKLPDEPQVIVLSKA